MKIGDRIFTFVVGALVGFLLCVWYFEHQGQEAVVGPPETPSRWKEWSEFPDSLRTGRSYWVYDHNGEWHFIAGGEK